ncbi:MAG: glycosyl hydrolase [Calditrichaeota bacterium]|nr:MAG: glycosyl hydrolase [Calditrichota bacterium]
MMQIDYDLSLLDFQPILEKFWMTSGEKIHSIETGYDPNESSPVFTVGGVYTSRSWTEWTRGFHFGSALLQFDATGDIGFFHSGRSHTIEQMSPHLSHMGVHDHGFNIISTFGNLLRLMVEGKTAFDLYEKNLYQYALKFSGAVQAARWSSTPSGGYIYSFNGPHSLFVDTLRSCRSLIVSHFLGHSLGGENDVHISLLDRAFQHITTTAAFSIYYGEGRDIYDVRGRTAHEAIFNIKNGSFRCTNSQQGYSPFSTWMRGLAWAILGFAEELEVLPFLLEREKARKNEIIGMKEVMLRAARAVCDYYLENTPTDGIPYWDSGAPQLHRLGDYLSRPAEPFNEYEPIDSSAAAISAQGLLRLGHFLVDAGEGDSGSRYWQAGLTLCRSLLQPPYLSTDRGHQGLLLHSVYHRPNGWDFIHPGSHVPNGESSMWGDYHVREVALYLLKLLRNETYYCFAGCIE